nr:MAG TPA: hypothetical protein [Caudoviricetes sp.]
MLGKGYIPIANVRTASNYKRLVNILRCITLQGMKKIHIFIISKFYLKLNFFFFRSFLFPVVSTGICILIN